MRCCVAESTASYHSSFSLRPLPYDFKSLSQDHFKSVVFSELFSQEPNHSVGSRVPDPIDTTQRAIPLLKKFGLKKRRTERGVSHFTDQIEFAVCTPDDN